VNPITEQSLSEDRRQQPASLGTPAIKSGLKRKLAIMIMLLVGGLSVAFFLFFFNEEKGLLYQAFEKRGLVLANNLARNVERYLTRPLAPEVKILLKNFLEIKEIVYVGLWDREGELVMMTADPDKAVLPPLSARERATLGETVRTITIGRVGAVSDVLVPIWKVKQTFEAMPSSARLVRGLDNNEILRLLSPNKLSLERIGTVRLGFSQAGIQAELRKKSLIVAAFFLVFLGFGLVILIFLARVIVDPLQRLARAMNIVSNEHKEFDENGMPLVQHFRRVGDLDLNVKTHDEIEQLADDFRSMVKKLEDSYARLEIIIEDKSRIALEKTQLAEELQTLNRSLEATIKDRTREIVEKNLRLYELSEELQFQKEDLVRMNEQLENTSRMKSSFLANMSHELRTPLNSIIGFAEILKDKMFGEFNERQEKYLSHILTSGRHLLQLINNILDLSKVEAGKMKLNLEPFSVNRVIDEVQTIIKTLAYKKNIEIQLELCPEVIMYGDSAKIKQILYNLLSNAIKFTPEKGLVVIHTLEAAEGVIVDRGASKPLVVPVKALLLSVKDTGIGISPNDQERIFLEFEQSEQTRGKGYEGTGLGLALTRKLVELHGGQIWVKSAVGQGSEFSLFLPIKGVAPESEGACAEGVPG
jgi:signal transduction histidine kinase/HAMP domain-containing protein